MPIGDDTMYPIHHAIELCIMGTTLFAIGVIMWGTMALDQVTIQAGHVKMPIISLFKHNL